MRNRVHSGGFPTSIYSFTCHDWRRWKTFDAVTFSSSSLPLLVWCFSNPPTIFHLASILRCKWQPRILASSVVFFWLIFHNHLATALSPLRKFHFLFFLVSEKRRHEWHGVDWMMIFVRVRWETPAKYSRPQANFNRISISANSTSA